MVKVDDFSDALNDAILNSEIDISCPSCNGNFSVSLKQVGSKVMCPHCRETIELKNKD